MPVFGVIPNECSECGGETWDVVQFDAESGKEKEAAFICVSCLQKAIDLAKKRDVKKF
jgi:hypothetical protein